MDGLGPWPSPAAVVLTACLGWELVRGTSLAGLLDGLVLGPLRHPREFFFAPELGREAFVAGAAGLGAALAFVWARQRGLTEGPSGAAVVGAVKVVGGAVLWLGAAHGLPAAPLALTPLLWVALAGRRAEPGSARASRPRHGRRPPDPPRVPGGRHPGRVGHVPGVPVGAVALADGWRRLRGALETVGAISPSSGRRGGRRPRAPGSRWRA